MDNPPTEPLREVAAGEAAERLLEALRKDWPNSIHVVNQILTLDRWRQDERLNKAFVSHLFRAAVEDDSSEGPATVVSTFHMRGALPVMVAVHSTAPSSATLRHALLHSAFIPWSAGQINFEAVHERFAADVMEATRVHGGPDAAIMDLTHKVLLPYEEALKLDVSAPPGLCVRPLEAKHAKKVNELWRHGSPGFAMILQTMLQDSGVSFGVFRENDGPDSDPLAHVMGTWFGGLGILHTLEAHRRKGLAAVVLRAASKGLALHGLDAHADYRDVNTASAATMAKVGFKKAFAGAYIDYRVPPTT